MLILAFHLEELNAFFLKFILWVPPESNLNRAHLRTHARMRTPHHQHIHALSLDSSCACTAMHAVSVDDLFVHSPRCLLNLSRVCACWCVYMCALGHSVSRLLIWALVGVPSLRQIYSYITDAQCKRIGHQTFLALLILLTELALIAKFGRGEFPHPMPDHVRRNALILGALYILLLVGLAIRTRSRKHHHAQHQQLHQQEEVQQ
jgi:hypothetical protein